MDGRTGKQADGPEPIAMMVGYLWAMFNVIVVAIMAKIAKEQELETISFFLGFGGIVAHLIANVIRLARTVSQNQQKSSLG